MFSTADIFYSGIFTCSVITKRGNPFIGVDDYQLRRYREIEDTIAWICMKEKKEKCKRRVKTTKQFKILTKIPHSCVPNVSRNWNQKENGDVQKKVREYVSDPV